MKKILWLIAMVALITVGCSNESREVAEEQIINSGETEVVEEVVDQPEEVVEVEEDLEEVATETESTEVEEEELKTYTSQENNFSFSYPANFELTENNYNADFDNTHVQLTDSDDHNYDLSLDVNHPGTGFEMVENYKESEFVEINGRSVGIDFWQNTEDSLAKSIMSTWEYNGDQYLVYMRFRADSETTEFENTFKEIITSIK